MLTDEQLFSMREYATTYEGEAFTPQGALKLAGQVLLLLDEVAELRAGQTTIIENCAHITECITDEGNKAAEEAERMRPVVEAALLLTTENVIVDLDAKRRAVEPLLALKEACRALAR